MTFDEYISFLSKFKFDVIGDKYETIDPKDLSKIFCFRNQFFYFINYRAQTPDFMHVSPNIKNVLGYSHDELTFKDFYNQVHPADRAIVLQASVRMIEIQRELKLEPRTYFGHINFRIRHKNGNYIHVARQVSSFQNDNDDIMKVSISLYSDISHLKHDNKIDIYWSGPANEEIHFKESDFISLDNPLSKRETELTKLISTGLSSKEIAEILNLSKNTVDTHRRNILKKLKLKNSSELIAYAHDKKLL